MASQATTKAEASAAARAAVRRAYLADEHAAVMALLPAATPAAALADAIQADARRLVEQVRAGQAQQSALDAFMGEYDLSSQEGVLLMCLAEALLRIPDRDTADKLIADKLGGADWQAHLGASASLFVNASTWGLMLTGRLVGLEAQTRGDFRAALERLVRASGEPVIRAAIRRAMAILGRQFVLGRDIEQALARAGDGANRHQRFSFDMLGEAALTAADADRYLDQYAHAIAALAAAGPYPDSAAAPGISVKLSALHPRYHTSQGERLRAQLPARLKRLALAARAANIQLAIDAEEAERLELQLTCFEQVFRDPALAGWSGFGLAVQAYQKRAPAVIDWLAAVAGEVGRAIPVRLVKGAYWDTEIKQAQQRGVSGYPVYTRKAHTDMAYLACARRLLQHPGGLHPQFATHNAHTLATIQRLAGSATIEFQRLHGMGEALYAALAEQAQGPPVRVYAPVGRHRELLPYLVRRLLENGANSSFINRIWHQELPAAQVVADPAAASRRNAATAHPRIPLPEAIFGAGRCNSRGVNLADPLALADLLEAMAAHPPGAWAAQPIMAASSLSGLGDRSEASEKSSAFSRSFAANGDFHLTKTSGKRSRFPAAAVDSSQVRQAARPAAGSGAATTVTSPGDNRRRVGAWRATTRRQVAQAVAAAAQAQPQWDALGAERRAALLEAAADLYQEHFAELMSRCVHEAGKTLPDAVAEIREAVDFLRYYADLARCDFAAPAVMPGYTGESNELRWQGRGVFVTISPWNFPLAIFTGQIAAALVTGNAVIAKPAEQTTLIAHRATQLLHRAGVPENVLQLAPGLGEAVGEALVADPRVAGVAFTGSLDTARAIQRTLAERPGPIATLIAETGGQNAMIVDSSALTEQVVSDVLASAFGAAGQRCSALRVLFVQEDVAEPSLAMLAGAMAELVVGDPACIATDIGPVIDAPSLQALQAYRDNLHGQARPVGEASLGPAAAHGHYFAPCAYEIDSLAQLEGEIFGPVLHVIRYRAEDLDQVIDAINQSGYGLTLGIHSRIEETAAHIAARARVGNCYVNRDQVGAIVGVQPFGGEGLSGTGPKAGGPHYLHRFATERCLTINTAAVGGNASLLALDEE